MPDIYRGSDCPVFVGSTFVKRAQFFRVSRESGQRLVGELNAAAPVGVRSDHPEYTAQLTINEVGQDLATTLGLTSSLQDYIQSDPSGVTLACVMGGLTSAVVVGIEYQASVKGPATATYRFMGRGWTTNDTVTPAVDLTLPGVYTYPDCSCSIGDNVQTVTLRATVPVTMVREIGGSGIVGQIIRKPQVEIEIECVYPGNCDWISDDSNVIDITLGIGSLSLVAKDCKSSREPRQGNIRGWVTNTYTYVSVSGNFTVS